MEPLLSQAVESFLQDAAVRLSPHTVIDYRHILTRWQGFWGNDPPLDTLTPADVRRFLLHLKDDLHLSPKTVKNAHTCLSSLFTWAEGELGVAHIIRGHVKSPKAVTRAIMPLTDADLTALPAACDMKAPWRSAKRRVAVVTRPTRLRDRAVILTLLDTGARASELCALRLADVDLKSGAAEVRCGKGGKGRIVYMGTATLEAVSAYLDTRESSNGIAPLFATRTGNALDCAALRHMLQTAAKRAGLKGSVHPHRLRHTFATAYLRNGGDAFTLQRLLGHSTMDMVKRYLGLAQVDVEAAHRRASPVEHLVFESSEVVGSETTAGGAAPLDAVPPELHPLVANPLVTTPRTAVHDAREALTALLDAVVCGDQPWRMTAAGRGAQCTVVTVALRHAGP